LARSGRSISQWLIGLDAESNALLIGNPCAMPLNRPADMPPSTMLSALVESGAMNEADASISSMSTSRLAALK
jgi:hypothetical protein